jgi:hypothetical protein
VNYPGWPCHGGRICAVSKRYGGGELVVKRELCGIQAQQRNS